MNKNYYLIFGVVMVFLLIGVGCTLIDTTDDAVDVSTPEANLPVNDPVAATPDPVVTEQPVEIIPESVPTPEPDSVTPVVDEPATVSIAANCNNFQSKLSVCAQLKWQFVHPFTGSTMEKEVVGIVAGKCKYVEQMPNNGQMECNYTESQRIAASNFYTAAAAGTSAGGNVKIDLGTGETEVGSTIDDEVVENPLQTYLEDGTCVISGY